MKKFLATIVAAAFLIGCSEPAEDVPEENNTEQQTVSSGPPSGPFTFDWSEYPSWSIFYVAQALGYIDGTEGGLGEVEKKWNVDIVLRESEYDPCLVAFAGGTSDASCLTYGDALTIAESRPCVVIGPTSTSDGADALVVRSDVIKSLDDLKNHPSYGLEKSVGQLAFHRGLQEQNADPSEFEFKNMDPGLAAQAMIQRQEGINAIQVWNPYKRQVLLKNKDTVVLYDSTLIPQEIIDCVVIGKNTLEKPGADDFACAVLDAFYNVCERLNEDRVKLGIAEKFSPEFTVADMDVVLEETKCYTTPDDALNLFNSKEFQTVNTRTVADLENELGWLSADLTPEQQKDFVPPTVGFNDPSAAVNFSTEYIERVKARRHMPLEVE